MKRITWSLLEHRPVGSGGNWGIVIAGIGFDFTATSESKITSKILSSRCSEQEQG